MNIALLIGRFPPGALGGAEYQAECWARRLSDRHNVNVVTREEAPGSAGREERDGFTVTRLPVSRLPLWRTWSDMRGIERVVSRIEPRPDVLLCFQTFISGLAGVRIQERRGIPAVVWIRGEDEYRLASRVTRALSPRVWRAARGVLVQTEENRREMLQELERYAPGAIPGLSGRIGVVPNGIELPEPPFPSGSRILSVGRLIPKKGMDTVIDAVAAMGGALTVAGAGPERAALEERARGLGLDARFEGFVDRTRLSRLYRESACVVLAARSGEGLPGVLLEAMAFARPVVATPVAGTRELVRDGANGLLVPSGDPAALRAALERLVREPGLSARLGSEGRRTAEDYAWERVRPLLEAALERWAA